MDNSISFHVFVSKRNGNQISLEELAIVRARLNEFCEERGLSLWSIASESAAEQSVHPTGGILPASEVWSTPEGMSVPEVHLVPPTSG